MDAPKTFIHPSWTCYLALFIVVVVVVVAPILPIVPVPHSSFLANNSALFMPVLFPCDVVFVVD